MPAAVVIDMALPRKQADPTRAFICPWCEQPAVGHIRGTAEWNRLIDDGPPEPPVEYAFIQCDICSEVAVQARQYYGEDWDSNPPSFVYPAKDSLSREVPQALRHEFEEARTCFKVKAFEATVVMVRRILEGTCKENGVQEHTLIQGLQMLEADGLVDATLAKWADALRILGNEGAHYTGQQVLRDYAEDALAFAEALLDHIYILRKRFEKFEARRVKQRTVGEGESR